jgi:hypothetical protein
MTFAPSVSVTAHANVNAAKGWRNKKGWQVIKLCQPFII